MSLTRVLALGAVVVISALFVADAARAEEKSTPLQLSLFHPAQIFPAETSVRGLRLNLIYGKNSGVTGIDLGIANHITGNGWGIQWGIVGLVDGAYRGWQDNYVNISKDFVGFQSGLYNEADTAEGIQFGLVNHTESMSGFQLALFNYTRSMHGLQVGLLNIIKEKESLPMLPIVNWSF